MTSPKQTQVFKTLAVVAGIAGTAGFLTVPIATYLASHPEGLSGLLSTPAIAQTSTGGAGAGNTGGGMTGGTTGVGNTSTDGTGPSGTSTGINETGVNRTGTDGSGTRTGVGSQTEGGTPSTTPSTTQQAPSQGAGGVIDPGAQGVGGETSPNEAVRDLRQSPTQAPGNAVDDFRQNPGGSTNQTGTPNSGQPTDRLIPGGATGPYGVNNNQTQGAGGSMTGTTGRREVVSPGITSGSRSTTGDQQVPQYIPQAQPQAQQPVGQTGTTQPSIAQASPQQPYTPTYSDTTAQQATNGETYGQAVRALW